MLVICAIAIFELAIIVALLVVAGRYAKKRVAILLADIDRSNRKLDEFKKDFDAKFGPDLIKQINAIFKLKEHPGNLVLGKDGEFHKINREY